MAKTSIQTIFFVVVGCLSMVKLMGQSGVRLYNKVTTTEQVLAVSYIYYGRVISVETTHRLVQRGRWQYDILLGPQLGVGRYEPDVDLPLETGLEVGFKVGILAARAISDQWSFVYDVSISPYYISEGPFRQFPGFLFEDAANAGMRYHLTQTLSLDLMIAFRHLSNANTRRPNGGINNLGAGLAVVYKPSGL